MIGSCDVGLGFGVEGLGLRVSDDRQLRCGLRVLG
jgi:hypothetical protein